MLDLLEKHLKPGAQCLDVGCGSGYISVCFSKFVGPSGFVAAVDHIDELVQLSQNNTQNFFDFVVKTHGKKTQQEFSPIQYVVGDGRKGWQTDPNVQFDVIHVGATAESIPDDLLRQLKNGGRMVIPVQEDLLVVDKDAATGKISQKVDCGVRFVPLTSKEQQLKKGW